MTTRVLQPDGTTGKDTYLDLSNVNLNYGTSPTLLTLSGASAKRPLIQFDLSSIPAGATIVSAILSMTCTASAGADLVVGAHRSLVEWYEGNANGGTTTINGSTWNWRNHIGSVPWNAGGGQATTDYVATATDNEDTTTTGVYNWNVTADVQAFVAGTATNRGWWMIQVGTLSRTWASSDNATAASRPSLTVTYVFRIAGTSSGSAATTGSLAGRGGLSGTASGSATVTGVLRSPEWMEGSAAGIAAVTGSLSAVGTLAGTSEALATATAELLGRIRIVGSAEAQATAIAHVIGGADIAGSAHGAATAMASGTLAGLLRGVSSGVATVLGLGVAYARSVAHPIVRNPAPLLYLTDGMERFDLLDRRTGYMLCSWRPAIAQYKGGGQWSDSSLAHGRRLVMRRFANAIEVMELSASGKDQDALIGYTRDLLQWIEAAADYWSSRWATRPIYLVARSAYEENTRFAIVHAGSVPELEDVYAQPFFTSARRTPGPGRSVFNDITLRLERGPWLDLPPGSGSCVAVSSIRSWTVAGWVSGVGE